MVVNNTLSCRWVAWRVGEKLQAWNLRQSINVYGRKVIRLLIHRDQKNLFGFVSHGQFY